MSQSLEDENMSQIAHANGEVLASAPYPPTAEVEDLLLQLWETREKATDAIQSFALKHKKKMVTNVKRNSGGNFVLICNSRVEAESESKCKAEIRLVRSKSKKRNFAWSISKGCSFFDHIECGSDCKTASARQVQNNENFESCLAGNRHPKASQIVGSLQNVGVDVNAHTVRRARHRFIERHELDFDTGVKTISSWCTAFSNIPGNGYAGVYKNGQVLEVVGEMYAAGLEMCKAGKKLFRRKCAPCALPLLTAYSRQLREQLLTVRTTLRA